MTYVARSSHIARLGASVAALSAMLLTCFAAPSVSDTRNGTAGKDTLTTESASRPKTLPGASTLYRRDLYLENFRFRRDGDPFGGNGEVTVDGTAEPHIFPNQYKRITRLGVYSVHHSRGPKKCTDPGCQTSHADECHWFNAHGLLFNDWFVDNNYCNPISVDLHFKEEDDLWPTRDIGEFTTNGLTVPYLNSPAPGTTPPATECGDIINTLHSKPARLEFLWDVYATGSAASSGSCDFNSTCGELNLYQFGQASGAELHCRVTLKTLDLLAAGFTGTRVFYFPFDTDAIPATGDQAGNMCGAEYRVRVDLQYTGSGSPTKLLQIEWFNAFNTWQLLTGVPLDFVLANKTIEFIVLRSDIGNPTAAVSSWAVFEQNGFVSGLAPCTPCSQRLTIQLLPDTRCPVVVSVDASAVQSGSGTGAVKIRFSEVMAQITAADVDLSPPLPSGTLVVTQSDARRVLSVLASPSWPPGNWLLTLHATITDAAGNAISDTSDPTTCGVPIPLEFCTEESGMIIANSSGIPVTSLPFGAAVYLRGSQFPPNTGMNVFVLEQSELEDGEVFVDCTDDGYTHVVTDGLGNIPLTNLGVPLAIDEYAVVVDVNSDFGLDPEDRKKSTCGVGLTVGPPCPDAPGPPMALWSLNEKVGSLASSRAHAPVGQIIGTANWIPGRVNGALGLNGATRVDMLLGPDQAVGTADLSVSAWVRTTAASGPIVAHVLANRGYVLRLSGGVPEFVFGDGTGMTPYLASSSPTVVDGNWHLVTVTVNRGSSTGLKIYRDDVVVLTGDPTGRSGSIGSGYPLHIGFDGTSYFTGSIDEVAVYDEELSAADVTDLKNQTAIGGCLDSVVSVPPQYPRRPGGFLSVPTVSPNPAWSSASIDYAIPEAGLTQVSVLDVLGRQVTRLSHRFSAAGRHQTVWDLKDAQGVPVPAGVYLVAVRWNGLSTSRTVQIVR